MDAATDSKVEIGCTMNVSDQHWQSILGTKDKDGGETEKDGGDNE